MNNMQNFSVYIFENSFFRERKEKEMKKYLIAFSLFMYSFAASAETVIVVDGNGVVRNYSAPATITQTISYPSQTTTVYTSQPTYTTSSYYYETPSNGAVLAAGITTGIIGALILGGINHHHHKKAPVVIHNGGHNHHGGHSSHKHH